MPGASIPPLTIFLPEASSYWSAADSPTGLVSSTSSLSSYPLSLLLPFMNLVVRFTSFFLYFPSLRPRRPFIIFLPRCSSATSHDTFILSFLHSSHALRYLDHKALHHHFSTLSVRQNHRPPWNLSPSSCFVQHPWYVQLTRHSTASEHVSTPTCLQKYFL